LHNTGYLHLKVSLLQDSFVREICNGTELVKKHTWILFTRWFYQTRIFLRIKSLAASASVLLIGSSEEIGVPITINQVLLVLQQPSIIRFPLST